MYAPLYAARVDASKYRRQTRLKFASQKKNPKIFNTLNSSVSYYALQQLDGKKKGFLLVPNPGIEPGSSRSSMKARYPSRWTNSDDVVG